MTYTEDDLRGLLAERTAYMPGKASDVTRIVRRGRRMLMLRWGVGVALTGAAAATALWLLPGPLETRAPAPAAQPSATARGDGPEAPAGNLEVGRDDPPARLGPLTRIGGMASDRSAVGNDLKVRPASFATTVAFTCEGRASWVVSSVDGAGQVSRCADGQARHTFRKSELPRDWTKKEQSIRVWVFPDTPLVTEATLAGCALPEKDKGMCDGRYAAGELVRYDVALQLAGDLGTQPGAWMVGVYDEE
ncbi:hypothetical protein [Nonomuraea sp. SBT364]|uniref:hypothetical protein n=1 Tax=Nonomuraea sp. SBT364 TaxID=1580530 RepID=UPI00066A1765|nr:hypothetical protein [Nonomuraea sp. SBT364]